MFTRIVSLLGFTICLLFCLYVIDLALSSDYGAGLVHFAIVSMMTIFVAAFSWYLVRD